MKIISYILSTIFAIVFFAFLIFLQPLQWIGISISQQAHQKVVNFMGCLLTHSLRILFAPVKFTNNHKLPENETLIFIANHQSMHDISPIVWYLRKHNPKFVSKEELKKGIPSISFNLRHGGACLINRKDKVKSIATLTEFGKRIHENKWSAAIFPEGTRSKNGVPKKFSFAGIKAILIHNPGVKLVPITINNSWKIYKYGGEFPFGVGSPITFEVHEPICTKEHGIEKALNLVEEKVKSKIIVE